MDRDYFTSNSADLLDYIIQILVTSRVANQNCSSNPLVRQVLGQR